MGERPVLLLVLSRRHRFTRHVQERPDIETVLLRPEGSTVEAPPGGHVFTLPAGQPPRAQAARLRSWLDERALPRPNRFCNPDESAQAPAHAFAAAAGLPHLSPGQVRAATDKLAMKELFAAAGLPAARHRRITTAAQAGDFARETGGPVVVKPAVSGSSRDVWKVDGGDLSALDHALRDGADRAWLAEEYVPGTEHQLCALVHEHEVLDAYVAVNPAPVLDAQRGAMNADITLAPSERAPVEARAVAQGLVKALGLEHGYLHAEFFVRPDGSFVMGEVAARIGGAELPTSHGLSRGFDMLAATADVYTGRRPELTYTRDGSAGHLLLPVRPGRVRAVSAPDELTRLPGVVSAEVTARPGDVLARPLTSSASTGVVHVEGPDSSVVRERMEEVLSRFRLEVTAEAA
ncbi:ATP-dependent carboxylate-amine ligase [Streptomyces sp. NPDC001941]|uniref:ATP-grasp domain-containing protein n=1 Tax=Streptomyces sp. NPDC001941 TaxID=3154659 RepID=UPI003326A4FD